VANVEERGSVDRIVVGQKLHRNMRSSGLLHDGYVHGRCCHVSAMYVRFSLERSSVSSSRAKENLRKE
jgi:hypothetical protein